MLGYSNRTLGLRLPDKNRKAGAEIRARLEKVGIYRDSGHEHFSGSFVIPVRDEIGHVREVYGRKIRSNLRQGTPLRLYLPGVHERVWNEVGLKAANGEVILCEALIDALTFWVHGFRNVSSSYGVNGFTDEMLQAFKRYDIKRVLITYDRDEAGNSAAHELAQRLQAEGMECFRLQFPKGMDANEYALKVQPPEKSLSLLIRKAEPMVGDKKTPEGIYILDYKKADSSFYKAIHISYPNSEDIEKAKLKGINPGGQIMIHGQKNGLGWLSFISQSFDWTNGCIALNNNDMDELWSLVEVGTKIEIVP